MPQALKKISSPENSKLIQALTVDLNATGRGALGDGNEGLDFYWENNVFHHAGVVSINCSAITVLDFKVAESFRMHSVSFAKSGRYSSSTICSIIRVFMFALENFPTKILDKDWILKSLSLPYVLSNKAGLKNLFLYWNNKFQYAVDKELVLYLTIYKNKSNCNRNVLSDDPEKSWLSEIEYDNLLNTIWLGFDNGLIDNQVALMRLLSMQYARRPVQLAQLKLIDFFDGVDAIHGLKGRMIRFPGAKDSSSSTGFRDSKIEVHPVADHLWDLYMLQRRDIIQMFEQIFLRKLSSEEFELLPLFSNIDQAKHAIDVITHHYKKDASLTLSHELFHLPSRVCSTILRWKSTKSVQGNSWSHRNQVSPPVSHRTGRELVVTSTRMRHTRARQLARLGTSKKVLSYWLGHSHETSIEAYYNDPAEEARCIDEAMSSRLTPLAMAFAGKLIDDEMHATRAGDLESKLEFSEGGVLKNVGNCGKHSFCGTTSIPIPCYRCRHFEPLVSAPHDEVLDALISRQNEERQMIKIGGNRKLLIAVDLSADIRAVQNCIKACAIRKFEKEVS
jgi:integrase